MPMMRNREDVPAAPKPPAMSPSVMAVLGDAVQTIKKASQPQQRPGPQQPQPTSPGTRG